MGRSDHFAMLSQVELLMARKTPFRLPYGSRTRQMGYPLSKTLTGKPFLWEMLMPRYLLSSLDSLPSNSSKCPAQSTSQELMILPDLNFTPNNLLIINMLPG